MIDTYTYVNPSGKLVSDQGSQAIYSKYELSAKVETMILKNDFSTTQLQGPKIVSTLSYQNIVQDVALMKHFTGLRPSQFEVLQDFLDDFALWRQSTTGKAKIAQQRRMQELAQKLIFHQEKNVSFAF